MPQPRSGLWTRVRRHLPANVATGDRLGGDQPVDYHCPVAEQTGAGEDATHSDDGADREEVSVVIPTIGRRELLRACLESLGACRPRAAEVVIVDQSGGEEIAELVSDYGHLGARVVKSDAKRIPVARNAGLRAARHDLVLMTDDDCTVASDWVAVGARLAGQDPRLIVSGRVLPAGDERRVPSTISDTEPKDYTGTTELGGLFTNNVTFNRTEVLVLGGFDEAFEKASDNELCYRWLTSGRRLVYEPSLLVRHHDWRSPKQLRQLYASYWRGQGAVYAKNLAAGDYRILRIAARDVYWRIRGGVRMPGGKFRVALELRGMLLGLPVGFARYLRGRGRATSRDRAAEP